MNRSVLKFADMFTRYYAVTFLGVPSRIGVLRLEVRQVANNRVTGMTMSTTISNSTSYR